ncbi:M1 family metallopeptidase [Bacillus sp. 1P10SD]|uniref:M1 family aminopeptidase n=1 Tax=Bacillus sp. 1P10SD TaxID=3132265 RepID=UPI0039A6E4BE
MKLILVILTFVVFLIFLSWTIVASMKKTGKAKVQMIGTGVFLLLTLGALFSYQNDSTKEVKPPKVVKTVAKPVTEEKPKAEEQNKANEQKPTEEQPKTEPVDKRVDIVHGPASKVKGPADPKYVMDVTYDSIKHEITGKMTVDFINNLDVDLKNIYFNVWANANTYLAVTKKESNVTVDQLTVNGQPATYSLDGTALHIPEVSIKRKEKGKVEMNFTVTVPEALDRFGWNKTTTSLGNWFPILAVYDNEGWNADPYFNGGESFYSLTGQFDVTLTTEKEQIIATTGTEVVAPKINGALATHQYKAENVRDFAMEMDPTYKIKQTKVGNVNVNVYYKDEHAEYVDLMEYGSKSLQLFSEKFGAYPWPELDICAMEGWFGGMEYPQLVMISIPSDGKAARIDSTTAHEIGHQWFYGIIGNNEFDEPWLDESFASYAAALFDKTLDTNPPVDETRLADGHLTHSIDNFFENGTESKRNYYYTIYAYGAQTVDDLRKELGDDQFYASMQAYFKAMKFGVSTTADFIRIMQETSKKDLTKFFETHRIFPTDQEVVEVSS